MTEDKRKSRGFLLALGLPILVLLCVWAVFFRGEPESVTPGEKAQPPNFVFILVDTLRADHLRCFGYERNTSPNIDRLAQEGVTFSNTLSQSSWTLPSMISIMSGKHIFSKVPKLPEHTLCLAQLMKKRGYQTAAFVANSLVGEKEGFHRGFDHFEIRQHLTPHWTGRMLNERLLPWMGASLKPPFFLYLHYLDPHYPYTPPPGYAKFEEDFNPITKDKRTRFAEFTIDRPELREGFAKDMALMTREIDGYDGEIRLVDECIGEVTAALDNLGFTENTVIVLTSDHGECLWDHPHYPKVVEKKVPPEERNLTTWFFRDHSYHLFQELIHVPLIIKGPGILKNRRVEESAENVDLLPTLLDFTGDRGLFVGDGRSLMPALIDETQTMAQKKALFAHCNTASCVLQPDYKFKFIAPSKAGQGLDLAFTLFDLTKDPGESQNLIKQDPKASSYLLKAIEEKQKNDHFKNSEGQMDEATKAKMRELGYL